MRALSLYSLALFALLVAAPFGCSLIVPGAESAGDADTDTDTDTDSDTDCEPNAYEQCVGDDVHSFDSCDVDEGVSVECGENAECVDTSDTTAECQCTGNWAGPPDCTDCAPGWSGDDCDKLLIHVDADSTASTQDGASWATAYHSVTVGVAEACESLTASTVATGAQVWVAEGDYYVYATGPTDTILMCDGLEIYGGFDGTETEIDARDPASNPTNFLGTDSAGTETVYHVVTGANEAVLDGVAIAHGLADGSGGDNRAGGLLIDGGDMAVVGCTFHGNQGAWGGAAYVTGSTSTFTDCLFYQNLADQGGAIFVDFSSASVEIARCRFSSNTATNDGGALYVYEGEVEITRSLFTGNRCDQRGGAVGLTLATASIENTAVVFNQAGSSGGGIRANNGSDVTLVNDTIWRNTVESGSDGIGLHLDSSTATVANSIVWDNINTNDWNDYPIMASSSTLSVTYSALSAEGSWDSWVGNITPTFVPGVQPLFYETGNVQPVTTMSASYDGATDITTLGLSNTAYEDGALAGRLIDPNAMDSDYRAFIILDNQASSIFVVGDITSLFSSGAWFTFRDPRISPLSPCIDEGDDSFPAPAVDNLGQTRIDSPGRGDSGTVTDMGAFEAPDCARTVTRWAPVGGDGLTWDTAFNTVQEGIDAAFAAAQVPGGPGKCEVWVSSESYYIYDSLASDTVLLRQGVDLLGAFAGWESTVAQRSPTNSQTRLLGYDSADPPTGHVNTVVTANGVTDALMDGFLVMGAQNPGAGGGMSISGSSMTLRNCHFNGNTAQQGAGVYSVNSDVIIDRCRFSDNSATSWGGGFYSTTGATLTATRCVFQGNYAGNAGGGLSIDNGGTVDSTIFADNFASSHGGLDLYQGDGAVTNSVFTGNEATSGAGMGSTTGGTVQITNSTFHANRATDAAGGGGLLYTAGSVAVTNCVMWNDSPTEIATSGGAMTLTYSDISGSSVPADHVFSSDPSFPMVYQSSDFGGGYVYIGFDEYSGLSRLEAPSGTTWLEDELVGMYLRTITGTGEIWHLIVDNWSDSVFVVGNAVAAGAVAGHFFEIYSLRPSEDTSPIIDRGDDASAPAVDLEGVTRFDLPGHGDSGTITDLGAYEYF